MSEGVNQKSNFNKFIRTNKKNTELLVSEKVNSKFHCQLMLIYGIFNIQIYLYLYI